jgi:hypothetical protein
MLTSRLLFPDSDSGFIREPFRCDVAVRLGDARRNMPLSTTFWAFTDAGRFQPAKAHVEKLYNLDKLACLAQEEAAARADVLAGADEDDIEAALWTFDSDVFDEWCEEALQTTRAADAADGDDGSSGGEEEEEECKEPVSKRTRSTTRVGGD